MSKYSLAVLRRHDFRLLLASRVTNSMAWQAHAVIGGWQIYSLTHSVFLLGLVGLAEAIPALSCALFAGHIVDISRPQRVYLFCLLLNAINTCTLFIFAGGFVPAPGGSILPWIFASFFISGIARSFFMPSSFSLLPRVVAKTDIPSASAWLSSAFQIAVIVGPALAGLLYGGYGPRGAWMLPVLMVLMSVAMALFIRPTIDVETIKREPAAKAIKAGWSFIAGNPILLSMMALDMFAVLFGGAMAMLPAFADQVLHIGPQGLGALRASPALGAIVVALILAIRPMKKISTVRLLWVVTGFGLCMIGFGLSKNMFFALIFLAGSGGFDSVSMVIRNTIVQLLTPDTMRGRVSSVNSMFIISSNEIGAFESGTLARLLGLVPSIVAGGCATLLIVAATAILAPQMRRTVVETHKE